MQLETIRQTMIAMTRTIGARLSRRTKTPAAKAKPIGTDSPLESLDIELTERCNLGCHHCYIRHLGDSKTIEQEMEVEFIRSILNQAVVLGCKSVRFTGGEPLLRPEFVWIYRIAFRLGLKVSVATNVTLLRDRIADLFVQMPPESISISLYGWDEESYSFTTGRAGMYNCFLTGIARLRERGIPFKLKYPPTKFLVANEKKLATLAMKFGFTGELPFVWELTMHSRRNEVANQRILPHRMSPREAAIQRLRDPGVAERMRQAISKNRKPKPNRMFVCPGVGKRHTVDAYGRLQLCLEVRRPETTFDLRTGSLAQALTDHVPKCRARRYDSDCEISNRCGQCRLWPACPVCPACSWAENGTLDSVPEYLCAVMHEQAEILNI